MYALIMTHATGVIMVKVEIWGVGIVQAKLIQRYLDGDVRVVYQGVVYVCKELS